MGESTTDSDDMVYLEVLKLDRREMKLTSLILILIKENGQVATGWLRIITS